MTKFSFNFFLVKGSLINKNHVFLFILNFIRHCSVDSDKCSNAI